MIAVRGLTKRYGRTTAVDRLSFEVRPAVKPSSACRRRSRTTAACWPVLHYLRSS